MLTHTDAVPGTTTPLPCHTDREMRTHARTQCVGSVERCVRRLQRVDGFIQKCIQLYDVTVLRHGLMLVGPTGGGKTQCYKTLQKAITAIADGDKYLEVMTLICNPKSITMGQLYGAFDEATHEWSDGILCKLFRTAVYDEKVRRKWIMFDGPVDALWIESMNTVRFRLVPRSRLFHSHSRMAFAT